MKRQRIIACVDMDAFFASVEQKTNPALRGLPIAVVGRGHRTVVTTSSYEARAEGVKTGMNVWQARKACPSLILVVGNNARYTHTCRVTRDIFLCYTPDVETYSIDEAFLDISGTHHLFGSPEAVGRGIKDDILRAFGIACTVGIGPNILMAKLASELGKPDGLLRIRPEETEQVLGPLGVNELWGIGGKTADKLALMGISTCGQLGHAPASLLRSRFGIRGEALKHMGQGICTRPVITEPPEPRSIGHSRTLAHDVFRPEDIRMNLLELSEMVGRRARQHGYQGRKVTLTLRYSDFTTLSRQAPLERPTDDTHQIYTTALAILSRMRLRMKIRLLGVCLSSLSPDYGQVPLIAQERRRKAMLKAMDSINERFGMGSITWGSYMHRHSRHGVISPGWKPHGAKYVDIR